MSSHAPNIQLVRNVDAQNLLAIASQVGPVTSDPRQQDRIKALRPQSQFQAPTNSLSSRHGTGAFPFHTDCAHWRTPPEHVLLYCCAPGRGRRATLILETSALALTDAARRALRDGVWRTAHRRPFLTSILEGRVEGDAWRFDPECMHPFSPTARLATSLLNQSLCSLTPTVHHWTAGDLLILANRHVLHARALSDGPDPDRILLRVFVGGSYA
jgi:alpha-ketoglutarate-dependent taurine dioxygenase